METRFRTEMMAKEISTCPSKRISLVECNIFFCLNVQYNCIIYSIGDPIEESDGTDGLVDDFTTFDVTAPGIYLVDINA